MRLRGWNFLFDKPGDSLLPVSNCLSCDEQVLELFLPLIDGLVEIGAP